MFSQRDEEPVILKFFGDKVGRFLDIGAHDGQTFSTTRALALKGWGGVLVEPSKSVLPALYERYEGDDRYKIIPCGIGLKTGTQLFYDSRGDLVSSFDTAHKELWEEKGGTDFDEQMRPVLSVDDLFVQVGVNFQFMSIDAEAWSIDILEVLPYEFLTDLKMICVEFDHDVDRVMRAVEPYGFLILHKTAENLLVIR